MKKDTTYIPKKQYSFSEKFFLNTYMFLILLALIGGIMLHILIRNNYVLIFGILMALSMIIFVFLMRKIDNTFISSIKQNKSMFDGNSLIYFTLGNFLYFIINLILTEMELLNEEIRRNIMLILFTAIIFYQLIEIIIFKIMRKSIKESYTISRLNQFIDLLFLLLGVFFAYLIVENIYMIICIVVFIVISYIIHREVKINILQNIEIGDF